MGMVQQKDIAQQKKNLLMKFNNVLPERQLIFQIFVAKSRIVPAVSNKPFKKKLIKKL